MEYGVWHTFNRGVEKRNIFLNKVDYFRGIHDIYEFNDKNAVTNLNHRFKNIYGSPTSINSAIASSEIIIKNKTRESLVDLFAWCLMDNHYHLFSSPREKDNLAKFHQKFGTGYTNYFNLKNKRRGVLFQGKYKKVQVINDTQVGQLVCYIHSNPLELWKPGWKKTGLNDSEIQDALKFLSDKENRWSSHQDYWGIKNFPSLINTDFLSNFFGGPEGYQKFFIDWIKQYKKNLKLFQDIFIEVRLR